MKRDKYVDIIKGICIICVVYVHITINNNNIFFTFINNLISQFFLPTFFIVSGFYLKKFDDAKYFFNTKIKKFYFRLIIYYLPFVILHNIFINIGFYSTDIIYSGKIMTYYTTKDLVWKIISSMLLMGREPIIGAMWFFISQIIALIGLTIISTIVRVIVKKLNKLNFEEIMFVILVSCLCISVFFTEKLNFTIPRISNSISVMILIYIGHYLKNNIKVKFNNNYYFFISVIILICNTIFVGGISLNSNDLKNPITFLVCAIASIYSIAFISQKIDNKKIGDIFCICGKYSFHIMVFHLLVFKCVTQILELLKYSSKTKTYYLNPVATNIFEYILYFMSGLIIPIFIGIILSKIKKYILEKKRKKNES